jgi:hypothetical protein
VIRTLHRVSLLIGFDPFLPKCYNFTTGGFGTRYAASIFAIGASTADTKVFAATFLYTFYIDTYQ